MISELHFKLKIGFCYAVIFCLYTLSLVVALGNVQSATSAGLTDIIHVFELLASGCATWMFTHRPGDTSDSGNADEPAAPIAAPPGGNHAAQHQAAPAPG